MPKIAYNDAGEPFIADDGTQDVPRLPISDWSASNLITGADPNQPTLFPGIRSGLSQAGKLLTGDASFSSRQDISDKIFGSHFDPASGKAVTGNRLKTWPEQMVTNAVAGDPASMSINPQTGEIHTSPETIERALDISGMAGGGILGAKADVRPPLIDWENWGKTSNPIERFQDMARQNQQGVVNGRLMSDTSQPGAAIASLAPRFYSALENAVKDSHTKTASADQWLGELRNKPGVKQEELDWVLHDLPSGSISKQAMEEYVNSHKVELKEVTKQNYTREQYDEMNRREQELIAKGRDATEAEKQEWADIRNRLTTNAEPKYKQWQLPGGESYREHLLTLPENNNVIQNQIDNLRKRSDHIQTELIVGNHPPDYRADLRAQAKDIQQKLVELHQKAITENPNYTSTHFHEPNIVAHIRTNERSIPGVGNSLHVEEIQSDWHQAGRKQGYKGETKRLQPEFDKIEKKIIDSGDEQVMSHPELKDALSEAIQKKIITADEAKTYARYVQIENISARQPVPDAPFKATWPDLALKRIIRQAAEQGKDAISWTPGEAQAARYDLSKQISKITYNAPGSKLADKYGTVLKAYDHSGNEVINKNLRPEELADNIGKEAAEKLLKSEKKGDKHQLEGLDLKVGGEGMKAFYDKMLVDKANAIAKKFGGKVEEGSLPFDTKKIKRDDVAPDDIAGAKYQKQWDELVAEIRDRRSKANDYQRTMTDAEWEKNNKDLRELNRKQDELHEQMVTDTIERMKQNTKGDNVHVLRITPQLRDAALNKGFSLFADSGRAGAPLTALTRVEHNPFKLAEMEKQHGVKLTPVESNPFALLSDTADNAPISALAKKQKDFVNMLSQQRDFEGYQAAIRDPETKKIHSGDWHAEVLDKVAKDRGISVDELPTNLIKGFINNKGRFLTEQQVENLSRSKTNMFRSSGIPLVLNNDINNTHDVPYGAGASSDGNQVFIDKSIPQFDEKLGKLDLHQTLAVHERTEKSLMDKGMPYEHAHKIATQAEKSTVQSMGGNWNEYEKVMDGYLKGTEHENPKNPPPDLYLKPYPHDKQELLKRNANQESMTHHAEQPNQDGGLSPKALVFGALKAAEYGVWYMRPATGPYLWALTIPVGAAMNAAPMKNRRGEGYTLHKLKPVEGNPFDK